jgi:hypothetical protein
MKVATALYYKYIDKNFWLQHKCFISFLVSYCHNYISFRELSTDFSVNISDWQGVDDEPTAGSENLVKSEGVFKIKEQVEGIVETGIVDPLEFKNVLNQSEFVSGELDPHRGSVVQSDSYVTSGFIEVSSGDSLHYYYELTNNTIGTIEVRRTVFYNKNKSFLSCEEGYHSNDIVNEDGFVRFSLPVTNTAYRLMAILNNTTKPSSYIKYGELYNRSCYTKEEVLGLMQGKQDKTINNAIDLSDFTNGYITTTGSVSTNEDLGRVDGIFLRKGSTINLTAKGYSNVVAMIYICNNNNTYTSVVPSDSNFKKTYSYTASEDVTVGVSFYVDTERECFVDIQISEEIKRLYEPTSQITVLTVGEGKRFTDFRDAIAYVSKLNPSKNNKYKINVYPGQYNCAPDVIDSQSVGVVLPSYVDIIGIGNRDDIVLYFTGTTNTIEYNNNISVLNVGGFNKIKGVTIRGKHLRYCIHDDFLALGPTKEEYENVKFVVEQADTSELREASSNIPYGAGAEINKELTFKNCIFQNGNQYANFLYHDILASTMQQGCCIMFVNCRFIGGSNSLRLVNYGSTHENMIYLYGNKMDTPIIVRGYNTSVNMMNISGFGNEDSTVTGDGSIAQDDIDSKVDLVV